MQPLYVNTDLCIGTSDDDEHTNSVPPAKKPKIHSSQSTGTDHDAKNGEVITV